MKTKIALCAFILLLLSLAFNVLLTTTSLEKVYTEAIVSEYTVIARDLQRGIGRALRFGKTLEKFTGMERILLATRSQIFKTVVKRNVPIGAEAKKLKEENVVISIVNGDGIILHSTNKDEVGQQLPETVFLLAEDTEKGPTQVHLKDRYNIALPIQDGHGCEGGVIAISFGEEQVKRLLKPFFEMNIKLTAAIQIIGMALLILALNFITHGRPASTGLAGKSLMITLFLIIGTSQVVFSGINIVTFRDNYLNTSLDKASTLMTLLKDDIEFFFRKGRKLENLNKLEELLSEIIDVSPELSDIVVYDSNGQPFYMADHSAGFKLEGEDAPDVSPLLEGQNSRYRYHTPLMRRGKIEGHLVANISRKAVFDSLRQILFDSLTVLIISILFFVEMLILANLFIADKVTSGGAKSERGPPTVNFIAIRPAAFLFLFGIDTCISFLPLYMKKLYTPMFGLSQEVILGLPISVEMLFVGIFLLISGAWLDRRGWHEPFLFGLAAALAGTFYSYWAPDSLHFILSRGLVGVGYGSIIMAAQGFVVRQTDSTNKAQGMAQMWAGVFAGSICGGSAGAMLAERIGYPPVFLIGAGVLIVAVIYTFGLLRPAMGRPEKPKEAPKAKSVTLSQSIGFLLNREVFGLLMFSLIPSSLAFVGFMYYFSPVYLASIGESQSDIGRIYMVYGVCLIYVAPYVSKLLDFTDNQKFYIFLSGILGTLAFTTFYFLDALAATALTALLLGFSGSLDASRAYVLKLKATHDLGEGKAMALFNSMGRTGQVVAPVLFGTMLTAFGVTQSISWFAMGYLAITIIFTVVTRSEAVLKSKKLLADND